MNLNSDNIKVFPATRRAGQYDPFSRLMSESTITSIINRLVDCEGFVINDATDRFKEDYDNNKPLEFNVFGYYIKLSVEGLEALLTEFDSASDIYAHIELDKNELPASGPEYVQIVGSDYKEQPEDEDALYTGVNFTDTETYTSSDDLEVHSLHILTKKTLTISGSTSDWWTIPKASVIKFYNIDGGEIS